MEIEDYIAAKLAYEKNKNITQVLKDRLRISNNTPEIIAASYDLQSGTYSDNAMNKPEFFSERSEEVFLFLKSNLAKFNSILDVGSGELTMFARLASLLDRNEKIDFYATDISPSRLSTGKKRLSNEFSIVKKINLSVADSAKLPFASKSIDLITTDHSLEPNGARLELILKELFRVSRKYCLFVEPSNSIQNKEGLKRMKSLGYIFNLEETIEQLGGTIITQKNTINNYKDINKSKMSIIKVPGKSPKKENNKNFNFSYTYPGTDYFLKKNGNFLQNKETGFLFPIVKDIPILLEQNRIFFSKY